MADYACLIPGARRLDGYTVEYAHEDYLTVYRTFRAMVRLAS
jgi:D-aminopeptidase